MSPLALHQKRWAAEILPPIRPADGEVHTLEIPPLASHCGIGGALRLGRFPRGFPMAGALSQKGVFALSKLDETALFPTLLFRTAAARFRERAAKSGMKNAARLWSEATEQVDKGWLFPPVELAPSGQQTGFSRHGYNVDFRFGVEQADKLRACDDLMNGLTNTACAVLTPIQLVSWGHLDQL